MNTYSFLNILLIIIFTIVSGIGDSQGFIHGAQVWNHGKLVFPELLKSALGFICGIIPYWISIRFLQAQGITSAEIITLLWFVVTIVGVAIASGKFFHWQHIDQMIGVIVLCGIIWLLVRTAG